LNLKALRQKDPEHWFKAAAIRTLALDAVAAAQSGHSGMPMGFADVATVLFSHHLKFNATTPDWPDRDRFILSAGHGSMLLYAVLYLTGSSHITLDQIKNFRQWGALTAGHPESFLAPGIETTTGPLGQGLANSVGFAIAEESQRARWGADIVDHYTYVVVGDGCLMEGVSQEAISLAGQQELSRLIVLWDNNNITIDGTVDLADRTNQVTRFHSAGWHVQTINGHDPKAIDTAIATAKKTARPSMIACKTHIAIGHAAQDSAKGHGALTDHQELLAAKTAYGWTSEPFEIPAEIKSQWEAIGCRGAAEHSLWSARVKALPKEQREELDRVLSSDVPASLTIQLNQLKKEVHKDRPALATRASSELALNVINGLLPETIGGSADLTGSNNTRTSDMIVFDPSNRQGRYIHYGVREHAMAAAMNGMALHGGIRPYGGTFMCFADYAKPAIRLAALMKIPTIFVMTHDSIGLGEDGPTHQPVEHLAMLRATPNLMVIRPADTLETIEAWEIAINAKTTPTVLSLTRQKVPALRTDSMSENLTAKGAYILIDAEAHSDCPITLIGTGSEVQIAVKAREILEAEGIGTRVVSMPCWELFESQDVEYRTRVLPSGTIRIAIEAGVRQGWDRWLIGQQNYHQKAGFIGMSGFGASAPANILFENFSINPVSVVNLAHELRSKL